MMQYVRVVRKGTDIEREFFCRKYPQKMFPRRLYDEVYREYRTNLKELVKYWINQHNESRVAELEDFLSKGNLFSHRNI